MPPHSQVGHYCSWCALPLHLLNPHTIPMTLCGPNCFSVTPTLHWQTHFLNSGKAPQLNLSTPAHPASSFESVKFHSRYTISEHQLQHHLLPTYSKLQKACNMDACYQTRTERHRFQEECIDLVTMRSPNFSVQKHARELSSVLVWYYDSQDSCFYCRGPRVLMVSHSWSKQP